MNAALGTAGVSIALLASVLGVATLALGIRRGDPRLLRSGLKHGWAVLAGAVLATVAMQSALLTSDFSLAYVAGNSSLGTPLLYKITGMWSALEGSILLWGLVLAGYVALMAHRFRDRSDDRLVAWAMLSALLVAVFFFGMMVGPTNPFQVFSGDIPSDGTGANPLLQNHPLVAFHPPMLYLGYVGFTVPFAFAVGALVTGRVGEGWLVETRRWTLFAWGFLTGGIVLGAWWSYEVLGWGGYWAWDPVENASILPWLTATAYLHSVMVQERRGMLRVWNLSLLAATFSLTILGTFLTRSGVIDSVHAFSNSTVGPLLLGFFAVVVVVSVGLIGWRGDVLRSPGAIDSPVSREAAFLANNVAFAAFAFVVLLGTVFPLVAEALNGTRLSVGRPYFDRMTAPIGLTLLFLMAVAAVLPWRRASAETLHARLAVPAALSVGVLALCVAGGVRGLTPLLAFGLGTFAAATAMRQLVNGIRSARRQGRSVAGALIGRSAGGMVVHLGVVILAVSFAASSAYSESRQFRLAPGETATLAGHTVTYLGIDETRHANRTTTSARVRVDDGKVYAPALNQFPFATQAIGTPSVASGVLRDVYLTLVALPEAGSDTAVIGVNVRPLVVWLWIGGGVMLVGTVLAAWPRRAGRRAGPLEGDRRRPEPSRDRAPTAGATDAGEAGAEVVGVGDADRGRAVTGLPR